MNRNIDPFDRLRHELRAAAEHESDTRTSDARATQARASGIRRLSQRTTLLALIGTGAVAASAAAAVVVSSGSPSAPSAGPLTRATPATTVSDDPPLPTARYAVSIFPDRIVGQTGWCSAQSILQGDRRRTYGGAGCGPAATTSQPFIAGGYTTVPGGRLTFAIVDRTVTTLQLRSGRRVTPVIGAGVPNGWRVFVLLPGENDQGAKYLRADGTPIDRSIGPRKYVPAQRTASFTGLAPDTSPCRVNTTGSYEITRSLILRTKPRPAVNVNGRAFIPCAASLITSPAGTITATILLDASSPGNRPAFLPGTRAVRGAPGIVKTDSSLVTAPLLARRDGNAWLVVEAGDRLDRMSRPEATSDAALQQALNSLRTELAR